MYVRMEMIPYSYTRTHTHVFLCVSVCMQVTAVEFNEDGSEVFAGGLDNEIKIWDLRMEEPRLQVLPH
jgi:WD40 repeat protein